MAGHFQSSGHKVITFLPHDVEIQTVPQILVFQRKISDDISLLMHSISRFHFDHSNFAKKLIGRKSWDYFWPKHEA